MSGAASRRLHLDRGGARRTGAPLGVGRGGWVLGLLLGLWLPSVAAAGGRWYAWVDRVPRAYADAAAAKWRQRGVPVTPLASERFEGVEDGFTYLVAGEWLFESQARARVEALAAAGHQRPGVQYFSDRRPAGLRLDDDPLFALEDDLDGDGAREVVVLLRAARGGRFEVFGRHADGALARIAGYSVSLYGLPSSTQGERATSHVLRAGGPGRVVVFEGGFDTGALQGVWTLLFVVPDLRAAPRVFVVPGAAGPIASAFEVKPAADGAFGYALTVQPPGGQGEPARRVMAWTGETFVDAR